MIGWHGTWEVYGPESQGVVIFEFRRAVDLPAYRVVADVTTTEHRSGDEVQISSEVFPGQSHKLTLLVPRTTPVANFNALPADIIGYSPRRQSEESRTVVFLKWSTSVDGLHHEQQFICPYVLD